MSPTYKAFFCLNAIFMALPVIVIAFFVSGFAFVFWFNPITVMTGIVTNETFIFWYRIWMVFVLVFMVAGLPSLKKVFDK